MATILLTFAVLMPRTPALAQEDEILRHPGWAHSGVFGSYDKAAVQRGFQIYNEVCSACHSMNQLAYRNLADLGYTEDEVKAIAATKQVTDGPNDQGDMFKRPGRPSDRFVKPFDNDQAARAANNGALPPDLSVINKAREGHEDYLFSILTGYEDAPAAMKMTEGMNYNTAFPGHQIAMPAPLDKAGGTVTYSDGSKPSIDREAHDVVSFLAWASEPHQDEQKRTGLTVMLFLAVLAGFVFVCKQQLWRGQH